MADALSSEEMQELPNKNLGPRCAVRPEMNCKPRHDGEDEVGEEEGKLEISTIWLPPCLYSGSEAHKSYQQRGNLYSVHDLETENLPVNSKLCEI